MKKLILFCFMLFVGLRVNAQTVMGMWKNIDDNDGKEKSVIEITERNGKLYGKVVKLLAGATATHCTECEGDRKNKPITGMEILWGLKKDGAAYVDGEILDPKTGKIYDCDVKLEGPNKLKVRGYLGFSLIGRTQYWYRVK